MPDAGMGFFAAANGGEQHPPGLRLIIHVLGFAAHMQVGAFMGRCRSYDKTFFFSGHKQANVSNDIWGQSKKFEEFLL